MNQPRRDLAATKQNNGEHPARDSEPLTRRARTRATAKPFAYHDPQVRGLKNLTAFVKRDASGPAKFFIPREPDALNPRKLRQEKFTRREPAAARHPLPLLLRHRH